MQEQEKWVDVSNSNRLGGHFFGFGGFRSGSFGLGLVEA